MQRNKYDSMQHSRLVDQCSKCWLCIGHVMSGNANHTCLGAYSTFTPLLLIVKACTTLTLRLRTWRPTITTAVIQIKLCHANQPDTRRNLLKIGAVMAIDRHTMQRSLRSSLTPSRPGR